MKNIESIKQRLKAIEEKLKPGEARIIVTIDGKQKEVSVSEYLDHRFEWEYEVAVKDCIPPFFFIMLKLFDDGLSKELEKGTEADETEIQRLTTERDKYLYFIELMGGLLHEE